MSDRCYDRSTHILINSLKEFQSLGVDFVSYQEGVDTSTPQGEMIFNIMASLAQFESVPIGERVVAGMACAKSPGKRLQPPAHPGSDQTGDRAPLPNEEVLRQPDQ